ncbi:MAG TPA: TRAM domain-containing protein, partial [Mucilaginibacter sp.]|nr:TRAM domain-containing protein [Mucilaginibacter sp.]
KAARLTEIVALQQKMSHLRLQQQLGKVQKVLIEGLSKKSKDDYCGRTDQNAMMVFPKDDRYQPGQYVNVMAERCTTATLMGSIV